ncbi:MAG: transposase, partial [Thermofilum sp.]|nr:transposase [Thermofilum sp.]
QSGARSRASSCPVVGNGVRVVPLNAWALLLLGLGDPRCYGGGLIGVQVERCDVVRLRPTAELDELLFYAGDQCARLINMENYRRRQLFFARRGIDEGVRVAREIAKSVPEYKEVKKALGSANFDETLRKVSEAWKSFAAQLKEKKQGKLPPWMNPRPPGYRKRNGERLPIIIVRADNYRIDAERKVIHLGYWNVDIPFTGKLRWLARPGAKRGRMEIIYDPIKKRWYAHISVKVPLEGKSVGGGFMGIDLGREVLVAAVTSDGTALLYKGGVLKSDYHYFERKIAVVDRALSKLEEADRSALAEERRRLFEKRGRRRDQAHANVAAHVKSEALKRDIGIVLIGYPWYISQEKPGKGNTNMWSQRRQLMRLATTLENVGIPVFAVSEDGTSRKCAYHNVEVVRKPRGLIHCPHEHTLHADVNSGLNIMLRGLKALGIKAELPRRIKVLSFLATPGGVKPINP